MIFGGLGSATKDLQVGVDFLPTGVAVVGVSSRGKDTGKVRYCDFLPSVGASEQGKVLQSWVQYNELKKASCFVVIARHDVQIFQLEKPAVEEAELPQAVSWKLKELISYDVAAAVVEVFEYPSTPKHPSAQINAVVANENIIGDYVDRIQDSGLKLKVIDIHELAVRNLHKVQEFSAVTSAILEFTDTRGTLTIYHQGDLYVAREIKIGVIDIESASLDDESLYDNLLVELQRSMDYFESHYGLGLVQEMSIFPQTPGLERMASYLQNYVAYELDFVTVPVQCKDANDRLEPHCFAAYCAALRGVDSA